MRVLFLDDDPVRHASFKNLSIGHSVDHVHTAAEAIAALDAGRYDLACLDHDLGGKTFVDSTDPEGTGYTVAQHISEMRPEARPAEVIVHSYNPIGAKRIVDRLADHGVRVVRAPFGTWHLNG